MATTVRAVPGDRGFVGPVTEGEYQPFPDVGRRNRWQERFEVRALTRLLGLPRGGRVLEIGCGRGVALPMLAAELAPSRLAGLDVSPALLQEAASRLRAKGTDAELVVGDVRDLPFPAESFDVVVDFGTCYHVARRDAALREVARVLAPGGLFVHETRVCQRLSHPARARGRSLPWPAVPELRRDRNALLWATRIKAGLARGARVVALALSVGAAEAPAQSAPPAAAGSSAPDAGPTRLFFAPTARSLAPGQGAAGLTEIAFPWLEAGLGHGASVLVVGLPPLEGLTGAGIVIAPKLQLVSRRHAQVAAGALQAIGTEGTGGVAYGVTTLGSATGGVTLGCGYSYGAWNGTGSRAVVFLGLDRTLNRNFGVVLEGWIGGQALGLPDQTLIGAVRLGRRRWWVDLGVVVPVYETGSGTPFPLLAVSGRF